MMGRIEMDRGDGHHVVLKRLVIGILKAAPGLAGTGNPIILPSSRIDFFNDRILEAPPTETSHLDSLDGSQRHIRDIHIQDRFGRQSVQQNLPCHTSRISRPDIESKFVFTLLKTAMEGIPRIVPSKAADTVPEYITSSPRLTPRLIPDTISDGLPWQYLCQG